MLAIDHEIQNINENICENIEHLYQVDRGVLSRNILSELRNLVEHTSLKIYSNGNDIAVTYDNIREANNYVESKGDLKFLSQFHKLLQISVSHYTTDKHSSEMLMLKYYEYILKIKHFLHEEYRIEVLSNIDKFPIRLDSNLQEYYEKIVDKIDHGTTNLYFNEYIDRYYIHKIKPLFIKENIYYEVTFTVASDHSSKFDRLIAFTNIDMMQNYAVTFSIRNETVDVFGKTMPINIIDSYEVSIRPCEINNFAKIVGKNIKITSSYREYQELMRFVSETRMSLNEFVETTDYYYELVKTRVTQKIKAPQIFEVLDKCREMIKQNKSGRNTLSYLLYRLNNKVIKSQMSYSECSRLSNLYLDYGCIPFDQMPFNSSPKNHNPRLLDLFECIDIEDREHEFLARLLKTTTEIDGQLFTGKKDLEEFEDIDGLIEDYNGRLYFKHPHRKIKDYNGQLYIQGYVDDAVEIIKRLSDLSESGIPGYVQAFEHWRYQNSYRLDCAEKEKALKSMFAKSNVAFLYGAAGTGKTTMINHISNYFKDEKKIFLANTNPAVDNLKQKVDAPNCEFYTVARFLSQSHSDTTCEVLVIDECSTVSNEDMNKVLNKANFNQIVLVGDVFQIESINFGNWFEVARTFIPKTSVVELVKPYRSTNDDLLNVWNKVRNIESDILEHITRSRYSSPLDNTIFDSVGADEIILCLNYDGFYGINNINTLLQGNNPNTHVQWGVKRYKIGDPILFNETNRFHPLIYNNTKGMIRNIEMFQRTIRFEIQLDRSLNEFEASFYDFELINEDDNPHSIIRFSVDKFKSTDEDDDGLSNDIVPFQIAYAISIHKAQGLEYDNVKIVITDEVDERVTHNIFYTAITRAKKRLKIYWSPETGDNILKNFNQKSIGKDISLLSNMHGLKKVR